jgi:hypothetical protein
LLSLSLLAWLLLALLSTLCARAGDDKTIEGFDRFDLGMALPPAEDEMYTRFAGPSEVHFGELVLGQYESAYTMELASGSFSGAVRLGFGAKRRLDAIFLHFNNSGKGLAPEKAAALADEFRQVFLDKYEPGMRLLDSFPGGADSAKGSAKNGYLLALADSEGRSIWLSQKDGSVLISYGGPALTEVLKKANKLDKAP